MRRSPVLMAPLWVPTNAIAAEAGAPIASLLSLCGALSARVAARDSADYLCTACLIPQGGVRPGSICEANESYRAEITRGELLLLVKRVRFFAVGCRTNRGGYCNRANFVLPAYLNFWLAPFG